MCAIANQPDAVFAGCVASLCLVKLCLSIVLIDLNVW